MKSLFGGFVKEVTIYTMNMCPYCDRAKALLDSKKAPYVEVNLDGKNDELTALRQKTGMRDYPSDFCWR